MSTLTGELEHPGAQELLHTQPLAALAYNGLDGFPRVIPIGYSWDGQRFTMTTSPSAPKIKALAARPEVALSIDSAEPTASNLEPAARSLLVRGVASIEVSDAALDAYVDGSVASLEGDARAAAEAKLRSIHRSMALITIEPRWARFYDFAAGRVPEFLARLAEQ